MTILGTTGVNANMTAGETDDDYHSSCGISASGFKLFHECPAKYWAKYICPDPDQPEDEDKKHFTVGKAVHCWVLEPERFYESFVCMPGGINKSTKAGKEFWLEFQEKHKGKKILTEDEMRIAVECGNAVLRHPHAQWIKESKGIAECSIRWVTRIFNQETGDIIEIKRKSRPDFFVPPFSKLPNGLIFDIKAVEDASPLGFTKSAYNYGYHIQAPWYQDSIREFYGTKCRAPFIFMVAEKKYPWLVKPYEATGGFIEYGARVIEQKLPMFAECLRTNVWPGYGEKTERLDLPYWVQKGDR